MNFLIRDFVFKIFKLNGTTYQLNQSINTRLTSWRNCGVSSNKQYISCYGDSNTAGLSQFHSYWFNPVSELYQNYTQLNDFIGAFASQHAFMSKKQIFTMTSLFTNSIKKYQLKRYLNGSFKYDLLVQYPISQPRRFAYQRQKSAFQLLSINDGNLYVIQNCDDVGLTVYNYTCIICHSNFLPSFDNLTCICPYPLKQIGLLCDNFTDPGMVTCLNAQKLLNGSFVCMFCPPALHQVLANSKCTCAPGFHDLNNTGVCTEICGDGLVFQVQCDDSNINSGDGCNSTCLIQPGFECITINGPTNCKSQILLRYSNQITIIKDELNSKATMRLKLLNPKKSLPFDIFSSNFIPENSYIYFYIILDDLTSQQIKIQTLSIQSMDQNYNIFLNFQYNYTIQNLHGRIQLNYQNTKYQNYIQQLKFIIKGTNKPLILSNSIETYKNLSILNVIITVFCIIIFLIGLFSVKFIGLQMILILQLIFFSQLLIVDLDKWPVGFTYLKYLKFSTGYNQFINLSNSQPSQQEDLLKYHNLNLHKYILQNFNLSYLILFIIFILALAFLFKRIHQQVKVMKLKNNRKFERSGQIKQQIDLEIGKINQQNKLIQTLNHKSYHVLQQIAYWSILPLLSSLSAFFLNLVKRQFQTNRNWIIPFQKILVSTSVLTIFITILNNFNNIWISKRSQTQSFKKSQIIIYKRLLFIYLLIQGLLILFFNNSTILTLPTSVFVLLVQIIFIILLMIIKPYKRCLKIHTVTIYINHGVYLAFLIVINMINCIDRVEQIVIVGLGYLITVASSLLMILSIIRLYYEYRYGQQLQNQIQKQQQQQQQKEKQRQKRKLLQRNSYYQNQAKNRLSQNQLIRKSNKYLIQNQLTAQEQFNLLEWLQKKNWNAQQKQKFYYNKYSQKPLQWLKKNDFNKYQKRLKQKKQIQTKNNRNQKVQQNQQAQALKKLMINRLKQQNRVNIENMNNKLKKHKKRIIKDTQYAMNVMKDNNEKFFAQQFWLKQ